MAGVECIVVAWHGETGEARQAGSGKRGGDIEMPNILRPNTTFFALMGEVVKGQVLRYISGPTEEYEASQREMCKREIEALTRKALLEFIEAHEGQNLYIRVDPLRTEKVEQGPEPVEDLLPKYEYMAKEIFMGVFTTGQEGAK